MSVPYEAADIPSKRNEFAQPDVSIILTFISYYTKGIDLDSFYECLDELKRMNIGYQQI